MNHLNSSWIRPGWSDDSCLPLPLAAIKSSNPSKGILGKVQFNNAVTQWRTSQTLGLWPLRWPWGQMSLFKKQTDAALILHNLHPFALRFKKSCLPLRLNAVAFAWSYISGAVNDAFVCVLQTLISWRWGRNTALHSVKGKRTHIQTLI